MGRRTKKKSLSRSTSNEQGIQAKASVEEDERTASTQDTSSELTEETPLVERAARKQRQAERKQYQPPKNVWSDLNLMCGGCCGAMEVVNTPIEEEEDLWADDENVLTKFGHSILHKAGFAPPVKIIRCTNPLDDDSVITTPKVLIELAKQHDKERFWVAGTMPNDETDGTVATTRTARSSMSISKRLIPSLSISTRSRASKSVISMGVRKAKKGKREPKSVSDGRFEI